MKLLTRLIPHKKISSLDVVILAGLVVIGAWLGIATRSYVHPKSLAADTQSKNAVSPAPKQQGTHITIVPILVYHSVRPYYEGESARLKRFDIEPDVFMRQLQYLRDHHYESISFDTLARHIRTGASLPNHPIILTFDDGWENQYTYAFPRLRDAGMQATFFITTNFVGHKHFLTWDEISELDHSGMTIGGHTRSHPVLSAIADPRTLTDEIAGGKAIIEFHTKKPITVFAYPFGAYNDEVIAAVKAAGYDAARALHPDATQNPDSAFALRGILASDDLAKFAAALAAQ